MGITKFESIPFWILDAMASVISIHGIDTVLDLVAKHEATNNLLLNKLINHLITIDTDGTRGNLD